MDKHILWDVMVDSDTYKVFTLLDDSRILEISEMFTNGEQLNNLWKPIELDFPREEGEEDKFIADFMRGFTVPVISVNGHKIFKNLLEKNVEFLLLNTPAKEYFALNVKLIDCLDVSRSIVERGTRSGEIIRVEKYALKWDKIVSAHMFRIKELRLSRLFVSNEFKEIYEENNLTGLIFYPVPLA